jgi:hypothetical protein
MNGDITVNQVTSEEYLVTVDSAFSQETIVTVETVVPESFNIITEGVIIRVFCCTNRHFYGTSKDFLDVI